MDRPFAVVAELARGERLGGDRAGVAQRERRAVHGQRPADPGRREQRVLRDEPARRVALGAAPAERRGEIGVAEDQRHHARVCGHLRRQGESQRRLDDRLHRSNGRGGLHVVHRLDLGHDDGQRLEAETGTQLEVLGKLGRARSIHAYGDRPLAPLGPRERLLQLLSRRRLAVGRDRVLEIEHHLVRARVERLGVHVGAVAGDDETRDDHHFAHELKRRKR